MWALLTQSLRGFVCGLVFSPFGSSFTWFCKNERGRASYPPEDDSPTFQRLPRVTAADFATTTAAWALPFPAVFLAQKNCTAGVPGSSSRGPASSGARARSRAVQQRGAGLRALACVFAVTAKCVCERGGACACACVPEDRREGEGAGRVCDPSCGPSCGGGA